MFHYLQHKEQFNKPLKRKDFRDAIEEIERDIENGNSENSEIKSEDIVIEEDSIVRTDKWL